MNFKDDEIFGGYLLNEVLLALDFPFEAITSKFYVENPEDALKVINEFAERLFLLVKVYNDIFGNNLLKDNYDTYDVFVEGMKVCLRHKNEEIRVLYLKKDSQDENTYKVFSNFKPLERIINKILRHFNTAEIVDLKKMMRRKKFQYINFFDYSEEIYLDFNQVREILEGKEVEVIYEYPLIVNNIRIEGWYPKREKILFDNLDLNYKNAEIKATFLKEGFDFLNHNPIPDLKECIAFYLRESDKYYMTKGIILKPDSKTLKDIKNLIIMEKLGGGEY